MSEETIELYYISEYENDETEEYEDEKEGVSIVSRQTYLDFLQETEWEPCECNVQGCLSCFLDETDGWTEGYGGTCTELWFGDDPATGKQWNPKAVLAERNKQEMHECQWCYEDVDGKDSVVWEGGHYHPSCLKDMGVGQ